LSAMKVRSSSTKYTIIINLTYTVRPRLRHQQTSKSRTSPPKSPSPRSTTRRQRLELSRPANRQRWLRPL
jgi:hypothetical protein